MQAIHQLAIKSWILAGLVLVGAIIGFPNFSKLESNIKKGTKQMSWKSTFGFGGVCATLAMYFLQLVSLIINHSDSVGFSPLFSLFSQMFGCFFAFVSLCGDGQTSKFWRQKTIALLLISFATLILGFI